MQNPISCVSRAFIPHTSPPLVRDLDSFILGYVLYVLNLNGGNKKKTARQLGISRSTLYRILENGQDPAS